MSKKHSKKFAPKTMKWNKRRELLGYRYFIWGSTSMIADLPSENYFSIQTLEVISHG